MSKMVKKLQSRIFKLRSGNSAYVVKNMMILMVLAFLLSSCYSSKSLDYLQSQHQVITLPLPENEEYKVRPSDVLSIRVQSRDPEQTSFFNIGSLDNGFNRDSPAAFFRNGYSIDATGKINLAIVGELKVSDLTVSQIRNLVQKEIDNYLLNATVTVQLMSFKVSVLGDVAKPGINYIYNNQATIFEALSAAGDLNISAKRKKVKLIRQVNDSSVVINLDLTKPSIIRSPYYFLHPNDVIYVETSKPKIFQSNLGVLSLILSAISTTILVLNFSSSN